MTTFSADGSVTGAGVSSREPSPAATVPASPRPAQETGAPPRAPAGSWAGAIVAGRPGPTSVQPADLHPADRWQWIDGP